MKQFIRFSLIGGLAFAVDAGIVQGLVVLYEANPYLARAASFVAAASLTWVLNRRYTFAVRSHPTTQEWSRYMGLMLLGGSVNYAAYALCINNVELVAHEPWLGVAAGTAAGLGINFLGARWLLLKNATHN